jgi:hypothetical protein
MIADRKYSYSCQHATKVRSRGLNELTGWCDRATWRTLFELVLCNYFLVFLYYLGIARYDEESHGRVKRNRISQVEV